MAFDIAAASAVLKTQYLGPIREQLNTKTVLMARIARDSDTINPSGKSFTVPLHVARNASAGAGRADGGTLPTHGQQGYETIIVPNAYEYARIKVTGPTIRAARDNAGAFVRAVESEIKGATRDFKKAYNRQMHSDGTDALAFWTTADNTSGTPVDDKRGHGFVHLPVSGTMTLDLIDATDNATKLGDSIVVTLGAVSAASAAITWTGTVTGSADEDYLVMEDSLGNSIMGIAGIISADNPPLLSGGLHGLPVSTKPYWVAQIVAGDTAGTNQALTLARMQQVLSKIAVNSDFDESDVEFLLTSYEVRDKYVDLLVAEKRYVNTLTLDGGFKGVEFNGIPLIPDSQCRKNRIYYVVPESMRLYQTSDVDWMEKDGAVLNRVANEDAYEATLFAYRNLGTHARNANGLLDDIDA